MSYLDKAAAELDRAHADNEKRAAAAQDAERGSLPSAGIIAEVNARRMEIADGFIRLAGIEAAARTCLTEDDLRLIDQARQIGPGLRASAGDHDRLTGWLLKALADRLEQLGTPAAAQDAGGGHG